MTCHPNRAEVLRGIAAVVEALDCIGADGKTDHDMAKIVVDASSDLYALCAFALQEQAKQ